MKANNNYHRWAITRGKQLLMAFCFTILIHQYGFAQIDSLENLLVSMPQDSVKVDYLEKLSKQMRSKGMFDKSEEFQTRACHLATEIGYKQGQIKCFNATGIKERSQGNFYDALSYHEDALALSRSIGNRYLISVSLNNMGTVYRRLDNVEKALECHLESLEIARNMRNQRGTAVSLNSIGNIYLVREEYEKARETFEECIKIESRLNNKLGVAINLNNIGYIYEEKGELIKALNYYERSLAANKEIESKKGIAISYNDIAGIKSKMGDYEEALTFYNQALSINQEQNYKQYAAYNLINIGDVYVKENQLNAALLNYNKALDLAKSIGTLLTISQVYEKISAIYEKRGNLGKSLASFKESIRYKDSLARQENEKTISQLLTQYETQNKEIQIKELQAESEIQNGKIERRKITIIGLAFSFILTLALLIVLYKNYKTKKDINQILLEQKNEIQEKNRNINRKNKALESKNKELIDLNLEKNNVLGIIAHDLRSPMNHIIGLTSIMGYSKETLNQDQLQSLEMISDTSVRMREMINRILDINAMDHQEINLEIENVNVSELMHNVIKQFLDPANKKNIQLNTDIGQEIYARIDRNYTLQVFENLIANAIKFSPEDKMIFIRVTKSEGDVRIEIQDQGQGIKEAEQDRLFKKFQILSSKPTAGEKSTGLGLYIVKTFVEAMSGNVWCESIEGEGATFIVSFKG